MMVQGRVVSPATVIDDRNDKGPYRLAKVNVLDETLADVVEVTRFLKDGEASPFAGYTIGEQVELPVKRVSVFRFRVQATV